MISNITASTDLVAMVQLSNPVTNYLDESLCRLELDYGVSFSAQIEIRASKPFDSFSEGKELDAISSSISRSNFRARDMPPGLSRLSQLPVARSALNPQITLENDNDRSQLCYVNW